MQGIATLLCRRVIYHHPLDGDGMAINRAIFKLKDLPSELIEKWTNTPITLAGRAADPLRPHPCEVANL